MVAIGGLFSYLQYATHRRELIRGLEEWASHSGQVIKGSLQHAMLTQDWEETQGIVDNVATEEGVQSVFLLDKQGEIKISSDSDNIGQMIDIEDPTCQICHRFQPQMRSKSALLVSDTGVRILRSVTPIENLPECQRCHDPTNRLNGVLIADFSTAQLDEQLMSDLRNSLLVLGGMIAALTISISFLMSRMVLGRIERLVTGIRLLDSGDYRQRVPVTSEDEIGALFLSFNRMAQGLEEKARLERRVRERTNELQAQTERLSTLYAVAVTLSRSLNLEQILSAALAKVLQLRNLKAGWVILERDSSHENGERYMVTHHGLSTEFASREAEASFDDCICQHAFRSGKAFVAEISEESCPWSELARREEIRCHACIPLRSKNRVLGVMNLVAYDDDLFSEEELDLLTAIGHQMGTAIENAGLYREIKRREALRSQLLEEVIEAREEERKRIARELHDEFAQRLSALAMSAEIAEKAVPAKMNYLKERLRKSKELALQTLDETRDLILSLRPTMLDDLGLVAAIRWCVENELGGSEVSFLVESSGFERALPTGVETALFRIIQEAVRNVVKHAAAQKVEIRLELREGLVTATVADDGQGFEVRKVLASKEDPSLGLMGMRERAEFLGGRLAIDSQPGEGTRICVSVPVRVEMEAE